MYKLRSKIIIIINKYSYIIQSPDGYSFNKQTNHVQFSKLGSNTLRGILGGELEIDFESHGKCSIIALR